MDFLNGQDVIARADLAGHKQSKLPHALGAFARSGTFLLGQTLPGAIALLARELFPTALTALLEALDDVNGTANMTLILVRDGRLLALLSVLVLSLEVGENSGSPGKRLGVGQARAESKRLKNDTLSSDGRGLRRCTGHRWRWGAHAARRRVPIEETTRRRGPAAGSGRRRMHPPGRGDLPGTVMAFVALMVQILQLAMKPHMLITDAVEWLEGLVIVVLGV